MNWCKLKDDATALSVSTGTDCRPDEPLGLCGLRFTRDPQVFVIGDDIDRETARILCENVQLVTKQIIPPAKTAGDDTPHDASAPVHEPSASTSPRVSGARTPLKKKRSKAKK